MKAKRLLLLGVLFSLTFLLCACRTRTGSGPEVLPQEAAEGRTDETKPGEVLSGEAEGTDATDSDESGSQTRENPAASRKEYREDAPSEIVPGTDRLLHGPGEGDGSSTAAEDAGTRVPQVNDQAGKTATQTVAAEEAEQTGVSEDADAADSAMTYFTVLLQDRLGSLFECQRLNVYWETAQDHVTVHKTSPEHALILGAGCYDVSARLLPENLRVDDGWVARKNPGVIVRIVDPGVPGSEQASRAILDGLRSREDWAAIDAVRNRRILLLSGELLEAPHLRTAAQVLIAETAYPALFADVDLENMLDMLMEEATGSLPTQVYYRKED